MKKFTITALCTVSFLGFSYGKDNLLFSSFIYGTPLIYSDSNVKDKGYTAGFYGYLGFGLHHSFESDVEFTKIDYKDGSTLNQTDLTFIYTNYSLKNYRLKAGFHYIISDDRLTDRGKVFLLSAERYKLYRWNIGIEGTVSIYDNYNPELTVYQVCPKVGFYFGNYYRYGSFYSETKGYYINLSDDVGLGKNFYSVEENLFYYYKNWTGKIFGWIGKQSFAVRNGGFVVYNLSEKHKGGYGGSISYRYKKASASLTVFNEIFEDVGYNNNASLTVAVFNLGYRF